MISMFGRYPQPQKCFSCSWPSSVGTVVKPGAGGQVTPFPSGCLYQPAPLPTYLERVLVGQAEVLPAGFFRGPGGQGGFPGVRETTPPRVPIE